MAPVNILQLAIRNDRQSAARQRETAGAAARQTAYVRSIMARRAR